MSQPIPSTPRISLEPLSVSKHLLDIHETWSDPTHLIWSTDTASKTLDQTREWMIPRTQAHDPDVENYAILLAVEGQPVCIGNCGVLPDGARGMLGYGLKRRWWGMGYMGEAIPLLLRLYWTRRPDVRRLHATVNPENVASVRILVRNGFMEQEVLPGDVSLRSKGMGDPVLYTLERPP
ncbi:hypothetical protein MMC11_002005 [Xylographa trunciseda]|nr:hypothetical protein [Xylographa trunciseda]